MKNIREVTCFGLEGEFYAIAEKHTTKDKESENFEAPRVLRIFEAESSNRMPKEMCIVGKSSIDTLRYFLNGLYDDEHPKEPKHTKYCACPECYKEKLLHRAVHLFDGLEVNRKPGIEDDLVHLKKDGLLYRDIRILVADIINMLGPQ